MKQDILKQTREKLIKIRQKEKELLLQRTTLPKQDYYDKENLPLKTRIETKRNK